MTVKLILYGHTKFSVPLTFNSEPSFQFETISAAG